MNIVCLKHGQKLETTSNGSLFCSRCQLEKLDEPDNFETCDEISPEQLRELFFKPREK